MLASRANEDVIGAINAPYTPGTKPGDFQPTPPTNIVAGAGWPALKTFGVRSSAQFRAPQPYSSLKGLEYAMDVNEIAVLGKAAGSTRSSDQTAIAFFWYENSSFAWNGLHVSWQAECHCSIMRVFTRRSMRRSRTHMQPRWSPSSITTSGAP